MKILFVSSGNSGTISPIVLNQGNSIVKYNPEVKIEYFLMKGRGIRGYFKNAYALRKLFKARKPDVVHAHYAFSAFAATLAGLQPIVVSLMGSDVYEYKWSRSAVKVLNRFFWKFCIVKSQEMKNILGISDITVLPNGVDLTRFYPADKTEARKKLGWPLESKILLFVADISNTNKNFHLTQQAFDLLSISCLLKTIANVKNEDMIYWYNASDALILTSLHEGSPNVIKEGMACNRPIIATDVGDVKEVFGMTEGCYIASFEPEDVAEKIRSALKFSSEMKITKGRERIISLNLDAETVASQIIEIYRKTN